MVRKANMAPGTTTTTSSLQKGEVLGEQSVPKSHWYMRYLKHFPSMDEDKASEKDGLRRQASLERPRTAPSSGTTTTTTTTTTQESQCSSPLETSKCLPSVRGPKAPRRASRPNPTMLQDVNAWLDASKLTSPLMGGVPYWRDGVPGVDNAQTRGVQYVLPVVREPDKERPPASSSQQFRSLYRRAKRIQVRMPSLQRKRAQQNETQKKLNRRSNSTPVMGYPYQETRERSPPTFLDRFPSPLRPSTAEAVSKTAHRDPIGLGARSQVDLPFRRGSPVSFRFAEMGSTVERQPYARTEHTLRAVTANAHLPREQSMGSVSDVPSYFSGLAPPSYRSRSRTASILTTSSFGCIDGMNPEQRHLSQQRALKKRGMKGKLKRLAQKCSLGK